MNSIRYENSILRVIDQVLLPTQVTFVDVKGIEDAWMVISKGVVKGETAMGIVLCLALAIELKAESFSDKKAVNKMIDIKLSFLLSAKPYHPNMRATCDKLRHLSTALFQDSKHTVDTMLKAFVQVLEATLEKDHTENKAIGLSGAKHLTTHGLGDMMATILTHGHTGSLASGGWGTALGIVRSLHNMKKLEHVYITETRPTNVGAYITAYEVMHEKFPATLIIDSAVGALLKQRKMTAVIVGAISIATNGDTANDVGTYQLALMAKMHKVPFYVAAQFATIKSIASGDQMSMIEQAPRTHLITAREMPTWNPTYDVTPAAYITAIITEKGIYKPRELYKLKN